MRFSSSSKSTSLCLLSVFAILPVTKAQCKDITYVFGKYTPTGAPASKMNARSDTGPNFLVYSLSTVESTVDGLKLVMKSPGPVSTDGHVNNITGIKAEINSTFATGYGIFTAEIQATTVPGAVTNFIIMENNSPYQPVTGSGLAFSEIDVEILGSYSHAYSTNVFRRYANKEWQSFAHDDQPLSTMANVTIADWHSYQIDCSPDRIVWRVDGAETHRLSKAHSKIPGDDAFYYPSEAGAIGLSLWDASSALGSSNWAKGPIDWPSVPNGEAVSTVRKLDIRCPY